MSSLARATHGLPPVSLDELVRDAELMTRVDRKYLVPLETAVSVATQLSEASARTHRPTRVLEIEGRRHFAYDSVYFDTADHLAYRLTAQRRRRRFKLRTRSYLDTGGCFLELKTKSGRGATVKRRIPYTTQDRSRLTPDARAFLDPALAAEGHPLDLLDELHPSLASRYTRTTLLLPDDSRATVDTTLSWSSVQPDPNALPTDELTLHRHAIIETKSSGSSTVLDHALWRAGHRPLGISKFGTGTAALHPELPHNKWARILRSTFDTTPST